MQRARRVILCSVACVLGVITLPAAASASTIDHFSLDSYHAWKRNHTPPATSSVKLQHALYVATVQGTFSYYGAINYAVPQPPWSIVCGTPEGSPQFGSAGGSGQVGFDAEFVFARPWTPPLCAQAKLPAHWINFQMKVGTGGWAHPTPLAASAAPSSSHAYEYAVVGQKRHHVAFRLFDIDTRDNYGSLKISLRNATAADCSGGRYLAFKSTDEAECIGLLPAAKRRK
jgi:hypothetical protein